MSFHRIYGDISWSCDECPETLETERRNFDASLRVLEKEGWKLIRRSGEWQNLCPECKHKAERPPSSLLSSSRKKSIADKLRKMPSR